MGSKKIILVLSFLATIFVVVFVGALGLSQAEKFIASRARKEFAKLRPTAEIEFSKVKINPFTRMLVFHDVTVKSASLPEPVKIRAAGAGGIDWGSIITMVKTASPVVPRQFKIAIFGLEVPSQWTGEEISTQLASLGYQTVELDARLGLTIDAETNSFAISPLSFSIENAGRVDLTLALDNAKIPAKSDIDLLKKDPKTFVHERLPNYGAVAIREISLRYEDDSFVERAIRWAVENGEDHPVSLVNLALENPPGQRKVAAAAQGPTFVRRSLVSLRDFLEKPGAIGIHTALSQPVTFATLLDESSGGSIEEIATKLALQVERD